MKAVKRYFVVGCLLSGSAVALAACGGADSTGDDFVAQANQICADSLRIQDEIFAAGVSTLETDPEGAADQATQSVEAFQQRNDDLAALTAPDDIQSDYDAMLSALDTQLQAQQEQADATAAEDTAALQEAGGKATDAREEADQAAEAAGLDTCAGILPEADAQEVEANVTDGATASTTEELDRTCNELATDAFLEQIGGLKECLKPAPADSVDFENTKGVEGVGASTTATFHGGPLDGQKLIVYLVYEDGTYALDYFEQAAPGQ